MILKGWIPFILFWVLMYLGREELGLKGVVISILIWLGLLLGCVLSGLSPYIFIAAQALLDIVLLLIIFRGNINITLR